MFEYKNSPELEKEIHRARSAINAPEMGYVKETVFEMVKQLEQEYGQMPPTPENQDRMNMNFGARHILHRLIENVEQMANPDVYPTNLEISLKRGDENAVQENRQE